VKIIIVYNYIKLINVIILLFTENKNKIILIYNYNKKMILLIKYFFYIFNKFFKYLKSYFY
jgi:hypothetical protein